MKKSIHEWKFVIIKYSFISLLVVSFYNLIENKEHVLTWCKGAEFTFNSKFMNISEARANYPWWMQKFLLGIRFSSHVFVWPRNVITSFFVFFLNINDCHSVKHLGKSQYITCVPASLPLHQEKNLVL